MQFIQDSGFSLHSFCVTTATITATFAETFATAIDIAADLLLDSSTERCFF